MIDPQNDSADSHETSQEFTCPQCSQNFSPEETRAATHDTRHSFIVCRNCGDSQSIMLPGLKPQSPAPNADSATVASGHSNDLQDHADQIFSEETATAQSPQVIAPFSSTRYQFGDILGQGSFGIVYQAFDNDLARNVAIKAARLHLVKKIADLFVREARAASRLRHPNIVTVHDVVKNEDGVFIVSDLIQGRSLRNWIDHNQPTIEDSVALVIKLCRSMDYAHEHGVVHRDLKPGNIVMDEHSEPHVLDFGLSQSLDNSMDSEDSISQDGGQAGGQEGSPIGTPAFMAPEQVRGNRPMIDRRSDLYSIGVILFQLLTGRLPFSGSKKELYDNILHSPPPNLNRFAPKISSSLNAICQKALQKKRGDRYQTAQEMAEDLQRYLDGRVVKAHGKIDTRVVKSVIRRRFFIAATVLLAMIAIPALAWILREQKSKDPKIKLTMACSDQSAQYTFTRMDPETGFLQNDQPTIGSAEQTFYLSPGFYHVLVKSGNETNEVYRTVPANEERALIFNYAFKGHTVHIKHRSSIAEATGVLLPKVDFVPVADVKAGTAFFGGGESQIPPDGAVDFIFVQSAKEIAPFLLSTHEVTWGQMKAVWPNLTIPNGELETQACHNISWDIAATYCEDAGVALPNGWELWIAGTNSGTSALPNGRLTDEIMASDASILPGMVAKWDYSPGKPAICGIFTGWDEWTETPFVDVMYDENNQKWIPLGVEPSIPSAVNPFPARHYLLARSVSRPSDRWKVEQMLIGDNRNIDLKNVSFRTIRRLK